MVLGTIHIVERLILRENTGNFKKELQLRSGNSLVDFFFQIFFPFLSFFLWLYLLSEFIHPFFFFLNQEQVHYFNWDSLQQNKNRLRFVVVYHIQLTVPNVVEKSLSWTDFVEPVEVLNLKLKNLLIENSYKKKERKERKKVNKKES